MWDHHVGMGCYSEFFKINCVCFSVKVSNENYPSQCLKISKNRVLFHNQTRICVGDIEQTLKWQWPHFSVLGYPAAIVEEKYKILK